MRILKSLKNRKVYHTIPFKVLTAIFLAGMILLFFCIWQISDTITYTKDELMNDRLASDIRFLRDELNLDKNAEWSVQNGTLYLGSIVIGNGTPDAAYDKPFYHCQEITGTFFYVFMKTDNDTDLTWVESGKYQQGHYLRVCGTTKGPNGENLVGTYIDQKVVKAIESSEDGIYTADANVNGRMVFCRYELLRDSTGKIVGIISDGRSVEEMSALASQQKGRCILIISVLILLMCVTFGIMFSSSAVSIRQIITRLNTIGTGILPDEPLKIDSNDELEEISDSINEMVVSLREKKRMSEELDFAAHIQLSMLPEASSISSSSISEFIDIAASTSPAKEVGGDFYDFYMVDDTHLAIVVADVSGKGIPASLFMVISKTILKAETLSGSDLESIFVKANNTLCESNKEQMFVTVFEGILDLTTGEFVYVNAGHETPFVCHNGQSFSLVKTNHNFVLSGMQNIKYRSGRLTLEPGDKFFQYSDGVTEATSSRKELFGLNRLDNTLKNNSSASCSELLTAVRKDIDCFVGEAPQFDDITMLSFEYKKRMDPPAK